MKLNQIKINNWESDKNFIVLFEVSYKGLSLNNFILSVTQDIGFIVSKNLLQSNNKFNLLNPRSECCKPGREIVTGFTNYQIMIEDNLALSIYY